MHGRCPALLSAANPSLGPGMVAGNGQGETLGAGVCLLLEEQPLVLGVKARFLQALQPACVLHCVWPPSIPAGLESRDSWHVLPVCVHLQPAGKGVFCHLVGMAQTIESLESFFTCSVPELTNLWAMALTSTLQVHVVVIGLMWWHQTYCWCFFN